MKFMFSRERTIASVMGLSLKFEKDVPMNVPSYMYKEVLAAGGVPESEWTEEDVKSMAKNTGPADSDERKIAIFDAFDKLVLENNLDNFTAGGSPHAKAVTELVGFPVDAKERDTAWLEFKNQSA